MTLRSRPRAGAVALAVCIVLIGLNLRTIFSSLSAVLPEAAAADPAFGNLGLVLTTGPILLLGVCAPLAPWLSRRTGVERAILIAMIVLTTGLALRGFGGPLVVLLGTVACGASIAIVNVLLPALVKRDFPHRLGLMSGLYTGAICAGAAAGAAFTHPLLESTGSWRLALAFWLIPAAVVTALFLPLAVREGPRPAAAPVTALPIWRSRIAWTVTMFMVLQAMTSFSVFVWLAPILQARGIAADATGAMVGLSIVLQIGGSLVAPALAVRTRRQSAINVIAAVATAVGFALCVVGPLASIWVWVALLGVGQGSLTALALTMIVLRTRESASASRLSGMMQCVGYGLGASGALIVGELHSVSGSFGSSALVFLLIGVGASVLGAAAGRPGFVGEESRLRGSAESAESDEATSVTRSHDVSHERGVRTTPL